MAARRSYGTGSLIARTDAGGGETWYGRWSVDGQRVQRSLGPKRQDGSREGLTRVQAEAKLRRVMRDVIPVAPSSSPEALTIEELGRLYVERMRRRGRKKSSITGVESILRVWLAPFFAGRDLRRIRREDVHDLISIMESGSRPGPRAKGDRRYGRPAGPKTIRNAIGTLSAMLAYADEEDWIPSNVAYRLELPPAPLTDEVRFLEPDDVRALADQVPPGPYQALDRALYLTAAMTGLRQGELCALRWQDVDWRSSTIRVRQNYVLGEFGTPKSRRSTRAVPMAVEVAGELDRLSKAVGEPPAKTLVFPDPLTGGPLSKPAILRRYRDALRAARLDDSHVFHDLRHTFGTAMAAAGVPMRTLQEWMGHKDIATTQRYADYAPRAQEAAMVDRAFATEIPTTPTRQAMTHD